MTAEAVTEGHPDKICDRISDALLDECLRQDEDARVALETMVSRNTVFVAGELNMKGTLVVENCVRRVLEMTGYTDQDSGMDYKSCLILQNIHQQSPDIAIGVDERKERWVPGSCGCRWVKEKPVAGIKQLGAGDQGIVYGYACNETVNMMPLPFELANQLVKGLSSLRKDKHITWLKPDGKAQVTLCYDHDNHPVYVKSVVLSAQHSDQVSTELIRHELMTQVIQPVIRDEWLRKDTKIYINPTGRFVTGGPAGDTGLTGRKIMVDTYGGLARHGGGAFSGKDPTKTDRSGAYMARYVAKNIVASGLAERCEVALAYTIGQPAPEALTLETFGTEKTEKQKIIKAVQKNFSFKVADIIETLELKKPRYFQTAAYGHFGREDSNFTWEKTDQCERILGSI